jgi:hypothetical protein
MTLIMDIFAVITDAFAVITNSTMLLSCFDVMWHRDQSSDYIFGSGYFIFLPFYGWRFEISGVIWSILLYSLGTVV